MISPSVSAGNPTSPTSEHPSYPGSPTLPDGRANPGCTDPSGRNPALAGPIPHRPRLRDNATINRAIDLYYKTMFAEHLHTTAGIDYGAKMKQFRDAVTFKHEPYHQARFLDDKGWLVDMQTVKALGWFDALLANVLGECTSEWVLKHGVRFHGKEGDIVSGHPDGETFCVTGVCQGVFKEKAMGLVSVGGDMKSPKLYWIMGEFVTKVIPK